MSYYFNLETAFLVKTGISFADAIRVIQKYDHEVNFVHGGADDLLSVVTFEAGDRLQFEYAYHDECGYAWSNVLEAAIAGVAAELADFAQGLVHITSGDNEAITWFVGPRKDVVQYERKHLREKIAQIEKQIAALASRKGGDADIVTSDGNVVALKP